MKAGAFTPAIPLNLYFQKLLYDCHGKWKRDSWI